MATSRQAPAAVVALVAAAALSGCSGEAGPDCSPAGTRATTLELARTWYLYADHVDFGAFDPARDARTPAQFLEAVVDSAGQPDAGRHFSYLTTQAASAQYYGEGKTQGYGFNYAIQGDSAAGTGRLLVTQVIGDDASAAAADQSPAFKAGFARGDEIVAVALDAAGLEAAGAQLGSILQATATTDPGAFSAALGGGSDLRPRWFRLLHAGAATPVDVTATAAVYVISPVPRAAAPIIWDVPAPESDNGAKKVGYLSLRSFISPADDALRAAFRAFRDAGVVDLVVDLRYDGGGLLGVATNALELMRQGHLREVLLRQLHNARVASQDRTYLNLGEADAIPLRRVAFIVGPHTASASELLPFGLLPYLGAEVALVGDRTLGKPVGQYAFDPAGCTTSYVLLSFQLGNATARAEYFDGLPDAAWTGASCAAADDLAHPMGDPAEAATGAALRWVGDRSCAGGPILAAPAARLARALPAPWAPLATEPTEAQRVLPGLL